MFPKLLTFSGVAVLLVAILSVDAAAQQAGAEVRATVSAFRDTNKELIYKISYSYRFTERTTVFIDSVGLVPARGRLAYFSYDSNITFRESRAERVLLV